MQKLFDSIKVNRWELASTFCFLLTSIIILPNSVSPKYFDSSAFPHLFILICSALLLSLVQVVKNRFERVDVLLLAAVILLILATLVSSALSGNFFATLTGDTQRFNGAISLFALLCIMLFHTTFTLERVKRLLGLFLIPIFLVTLLGALQIWNLISLPGAGGAGSTLGNIDFLSAWAGTTLPLFIYFLTKNNWRTNIPIIFAIFLSVYVLYKLNVKQGILDLALTIVFVGGYLLRKQISGLDLGKKLWYGLLGLASLLWLELILLLPLQKSSFPIFGNDPNIKIRTQYWIAGAKTWLSHFFFGVGPDNYGNYYQQYRTLSSVRTEELVSSNDAHSALYQTLATLGLFGSLAFLAIFTLLVIAIIRNFRKYQDNHKLFYFLTFFLVIYSTNAMASPITLPHKFIFWSIVGLIFGLAHKERVEVLEDEAVDIIKFENLEKYPETTQKVNITNLEESLLIRIGLKKLTLSARLIIIVVTLISIASLTFISLAQAKLIPVINDLSNNPKSERVLNYSHNFALPCTYYYLTEQTIANQKSVEKVVKFAKDEIKVNPRCIDARITLAKYYTSTGQNGLAGWQLNELMKLAPANRDVLGIIGEVATRLGDKNLLGMLHNHEVKLGYIK